MSVAEIHDFRSRGAVAIGRLIPKMDLFDEQGLPPLPTCLSTRRERERYAHKIKGFIGNRAYPRSLADRISLGQSLRMRAVKVLDRLSLRGSGPIGVSRTQWLRLKQLSLFCARDQDWASESGPIIGATTTTLASYLSVNDVNEALAPLLRHGLIALWAPCANGRRTFHVARANSDDETVYGSGWTLAPLILHLTELEEMVENEQDRLASRQSIVVETRSMLKLIQQDLMSTDITGEELEAARALSSRFHNARKGRLSVLEQCHSEAQTMLASRRQYFDPCAGSGEEDPSPGLTKPVPVIYKEDSSKQQCTANQQGADGMGSAMPMTQAKRGIVDCGLAEANYHPSEATVLFPETEGLVETTETSPAGTIPTLAAISGISSSLAWRVELSIGALPTSVCLLIIAQKLATGQLLTTPDQYLGGMWKRARSGDLNLGKSIKGLRKRAVHQNLDQIPGVTTAICANGRPSNYGNEISRVRA